MVYSVIEKYVRETYLNVEDPVFRIDSYDIQKCNGKYVINFRATANDCLYIQTGKKVDFSIDVKLDNGIVVEGNIHCSGLSEFEMQEFK